MVGRGFRFSRNVRTVEVIKLFIIWHAKIKQKSQSQRRGSDHFTSDSAPDSAQACDRPVGITGE